MRKAEELFGLHQKRRKNRLAAKPLWFGNADVIITSTVGHPASPSARLSIIRAFFKGLLR
jgi:hypothetical protein